MNQETAQRLAERAQHLTAVKNTPSWPIVKGLIEEKIEGRLRVFLSASNETDASLHYGRGYLQGMRVMLLMIEGGEKAYEDAIRRAQALEGAEGAE